MSEADDLDFWLSNQLNWFGHITEKSVEAALAEFELPTAKSNRWLTAKIREAFLCNVGSEEEIDEYPGQLAVRREVEAIADSIAETKRLFKERSDWAESVFRRYSQYDNFDWDNMPDWDAPIDKEPDALDLLDAGKKGWWVESSNKIALGSSDWKRFREMVCGMLELESFMRKAAQKLCSPNDPPRWRATEKKKRRLSFASDLAVVFEEAYERAATINSWPGEDGNPILGPWPNFFDRIACLVFQIDKVPDIEGLLKRARRMRLNKEMADADGIHNQFDLEFAQERFDFVCERLEAAGGIMFRRFVAQKSP